jgi:hypothetical protein
MQCDNNRWSIRDLYSSTLVATTEPIESFKGLKFLCSILYVNLYPEAALSNLGLGMLKKILAIIELFGGFCSMFT